MCEGYADFCPVIAAVLSALAISRERERLIITGIRRKAEPADGKQE
jgi:hypothetical protein